MFQCGGLWGFTRKLQLEARPKQQAKSASRNRNSLELIMTMRRDLHNPESQSPETKSHNAWTCLQAPRLYLDCLCRLENGDPRFRADVGGPRGHQAVASFVVRVSV